MRVWFDKDNMNYYLAYTETKKVIRINSAAGKKIVRLCETPLEQFTQAGLFKEIAKFGSLIK